MFLKVMADKLKFTRCSTQKAILYTKLTHWLTAYPAAVILSIVVGLGAQSLSSDIIAGIIILGAAILAHVIWGIIIENRETQN